ncbi:MAG: hypothetical protein ACK58L_13825 [Planctomycetota bacterium]
MNKAFVREPDADSRVMCPNCGSIGVSVGAGPLNTHIRCDQRQRIGDSAWCCSNADCHVVYYDIFEQSIRVEDLNSSVYPYDLNATICPCFGLTWNEIDLDSREPVPSRIRELAAKAGSQDARCQTLAVDGQCCLKEVQRLYLRLRSQA